MDVLINEPVTVIDMELRACQTLPKQVWDYYSSGSSEERTLVENRQAFQRFILLPRFMRDVSHIDMSTTILGSKIDIPICIAPTAFQRLAHDQGEIATVRAAKVFNTAMVLSTVASTSIEDLSQAEPNSLRWFQLYIFKNRSIAQDLILRAEKCGFKALVLTIDAPSFGQRTQDVRNKFDLPPHIILPNVKDYIKKCMTDTNKKEWKGFTKELADMYDSSITWKDIQWIKSISNLPIVIKGILTPEDATLAVDHGVDAIFVSNHGGRQLDSSPATIDVLPSIVEAVGHKCEVYFDGGIRTGTDAFKALAIGARAVFIGRPVIWGLAFNGSQGVLKTLEILTTELKSAMALSGCSKISDINPNLIRSATDHQQRIIATLEHLRSRL